ncbi:hypothetical protein GCM10027300_08850 [Modestobacter lapidis]
MLARRASITVSEPFPNNASRNCASSSAHAERWSFNITRNGAQDGFETVADEFGAWLMTDMSIS